MGLLPTFMLLALHQVIASPQSTHPSASTSNSASTLLDVVVQALGGSDVLHSINGFSLESVNIYRTQTLTQNYRLDATDQPVAESGTQILSFQEINGSLVERIDRQYRYGDYWTWALPALEPSFNYSLIVRDGSDGFACLNYGDSDFYSYTGAGGIQGYLDSYLTDYLINQAHQYNLVWVLEQFGSSTTPLQAYSTSDTSAGVAYQALLHRDLGLSLLIDGSTGLPHAIRSFEQNAVFGNSTNDIVFTNYSSVSLGNTSIMLPHRFMTVYNDRDVLEDFIVDQIVINPKFTSDFFDAKPPSKGQTQRSPPAQSTEYPRAEVHELFEAGLWGGPFGEIFNTSDVVIEYPIPGLDTVKSIYVGYADYVQLLIEFGDGLLITDAAPHRSRIILDWVNENMPGKQIKYVFPTHHHRDHAGGMADYVAAGASLVVPEVAKDFYSKTNGGNVTFITYSDHTSFMKQDNNIQFRSFWHDQSPHARDWSYALVGPTCPDSNSTFVVYNADIVSPGDPDGLRWDTAYARQWLIYAAQDGVPQSATVLGTHGSAVTDGVSNAYPLQRVIDLVGFAYPPISVDGMAAESCLQ